MSGPIVRKYGFPNHDQIFGKRDAEHGEQPQPTDPAKPVSDAERGQGEPQPDPTDANIGGAVEPPTEFGKAVD